MRKPIKKLVFANQDVVNYMVPRQMPWPPAYRTKLTMNWMARISVGDLPATGGPYVYIGLNYIYLPINNSTWAGNLPFTVTSSIDDAILQPTALAQFAPTSGQLYRNWRVYSSKLSITGAPTNPLDYFELTITPSRLLGVPANVGVAMAQPYTRTLTSFTGKGPSTVSNYITVHKLMGVSPQAIQDDLSAQLTGSYTGTLPGTPFYWIVNIQTLDGTQNDGIIDFMFKMTYWVEFLNPSSAGFPVT